MNEVMKWVGIGGAAWLVLSVIVAVGWCRAKNAQPRIQPLYDGEEGDATSIFGSRRQGR